jgi:acetyl-CoA acetyltransferase
MKPLREVAVAGIGLTKFDRYDGEKGRPYKDYATLGAEAILGALTHADLQWRDIQAAFCGSVYQGTASGHQTIAKIGLTGIPIVNIENACSSSSSAFRFAYQSIATELYDIALAFGVEKVPSGFIRSTGWPDWQRCMGFNVLPAMYALKTMRYMEETGATVEHFAKVSVKNRKNASLNPKAIFQKKTTITEVLSSRLIALPLRLLHCCPNADGAAAVILCTKEKLRTRSKAVTIAASMLTSGVHGEEYGGGSVKIKNPSTVELSAKQAWEASGYGPEDMDIVQAYDAMAPGELWDLEELGFCRKGEAFHLLEEGVFDINGRLPVNTDGGLIGRGHPIGATALAQIIEICMQLWGKAGARQVAGAKIGLAHSMGVGPNSLITILKR